MGLHDRSSTGKRAGGDVVDAATRRRSTPRRSARARRPVRRAEDPRPPRRASRSSAPSSSSRRHRGPRRARLRAVTEQLALDRTPLTREERRQLVREITDDILGYGPLEPFLRDDSVTEVMVNALDRIYVERAGKLERTHVRVRRRRAPAADHRQDRLAGRPPHRRVVADGRRAPPRRQPRQRDHPAARAARARR